MDGSAYNIFSAASMAPFMAVDSKVALIFNIKTKDLSTFTYHSANLKNFCEFRTKIVLKSVFHKYKLMIRMSFIHSGRGRSKLAV